MIRRISLTILVLVVCGCASKFHETHYFKSETLEKKIPNYYRLTVDGYSYFSSSRYISGYFDEDTLNAYFNEYTQPAGAAIMPSAKASETKAATKNTSAETVQPIAKGLQGQGLIMILSSNSDAIATQIGALADSKQFTASLTNLMARDQYVAADAAESRLAIEKFRAKATASLASQVVSTLPDTPTAAAAEQQLLAFINFLASDLGYEGAFTDLDSAAKWLYMNRARLMRREP
jgi:hypothetical protein